MLSEIQRTNRGSQGLASQSRRRSDKGNPEVRTTRNIGPEDDNAGRTQGRHQHQGTNAPHTSSTHTRRKHHKQRPHTRRNTRNVSQKRRIAATGKPRRERKKTSPKQPLKIGGRPSRRATAGQSRPTGLPRPANPDRPGCHGRTIQTDTGCLPLRTAAPIQELRSICYTNPGAAVGGKACSLHCSSGDGRLMTSVWALSQTLQTRTRRRLWLTSLRRHEIHHERRDDTRHRILSIVA